MGKKDKNHEQMITPSLSEIKKGKLMFTNYDMILDKIWNIYHSCYPSFLNLTLSVMHILITILKTFITTTNPGDDDLGNK